MRKVASLDCRRVQPTQLPCSVQCCRSHVLVNVLSPLACSTRPFGAAQARSVESVFRKPVLHELLREKEPPRNVRDDVEGIGYTGEELAANAKKTYGRPIGTSR